MFEQFVEYNVTLTVFFFSQTMSTSLLILIAIFELCQSQFIGIFDTLYSFNDAYDACQSLYGTSLAIINNDEENNAALQICDGYCNFPSNIVDCSCWIGLHLKVGSTYWEWLTTSISILSSGDYGYTPEITPWRAEEPSQLADGTTTVRKCTRIDYDVSHGNKVSCNSF